MTVHFYMIKNCSMETINGRRMLIAPPGTERSLLHEYGFHPLGQGRMFRTLSDQEYEFILHEAQNQPPGTPVSFSMTEQDKTGVLDMMKNKRAGNRLCILSVLFLIIQIPVFLYGAKYLSLIGVNTKNTPLIPVCLAVFSLAAWILLIIVRVRYPENKTAQYLLPAYGVIFGSLLLGWLILQMLCAQCESDCARNCDCSGMGFFYGLFP